MRGWPPTMAATPSFYHSICTHKLFHVDSVCEDGREVFQVEKSLAYWRKNVDTCCFFSCGLRQKSIKMDYCNIHHPGGQHTRTHIYCKWQSRRPNVIFFYQVAKGKLSVVIKLQFLPCPHYKIVTRVCLS
jgi:hypothetical protein